MQLDVPRARSPLVLLVIADHTLRRTAHTLLDRQGFVVVEAIHAAHALRRIDEGLVAFAVVTDQTGLVDALAERAPDVTTILLGEQPRRWNWPEETVAIASDAATLVPAMDLALDRLAVRLSVDAAIARRVVITPLWDDVFRRSAWAAIVEGQEHLHEGRQLIAEVEAKLRGRYPRARVRLRNRPLRFDRSEAPVWFCDRDGEVA